MFNTNAFENLIKKQPLMVAMLKKLGNEYISFSLSEENVNDAHLKRFYAIAKEHKLFSGTDLSVPDVKEMLKYIS